MKKYMVLGYDLATPTKNYCISFEAVSDEEALKIADAKLREEDPDAVFESLWTCIK